nr:hypothetical protein [Trentepohlia sp. YN1317]
MWENAVLEKIKASNFYPIDCTNGHIAHKFESILKKVSREKRNVIQLLIQDWVKTDDFWSRLKMTKNEYLASKIYQSLIDTTVIAAQTILLEQIHQNNVSVNKNGKNAHLFKYYTRANKQYYFYYPTIKSTILKWLDSKEFLDNFNCPSIPFFSTVRPFPFSLWEKDRPTGRRHSSRLETTAKNATGFRLRKPSTEKRSTDREKTKILKKAYYIFFSFMHVLHA